MRVYDYKKDKVHPALLAGVNKSLSSEYKRLSENIKTSKRLNKVEEHQILDMDYSYRYLRSAPDSSDVNFATTSRLYMDLQWVYDRQQDGFLEKYPPKKHSDRPFDELYSDLAYRTYQIMNKCDPAFREGTPSHNILKIKHSLENKSPQFLNRMGHIADRCFDRENVGDFKFKDYRKERKQVEKPKTFSKKLNRRVPSTDWLFDEKGFGCMEP